MNGSSTVDARGGLRLPFDLHTRIAEISETAAHDAWLIGGSWLTGPRLGPALRPPGNAAAIARELLDWIAENTFSSTLASLDGAALLTERAAYTGWTRNGSTSLGGAARILQLRDGAPAAVSCARPDDPLLYEVAFGTPVPAGDPWPALSYALASATSETVRQAAIDFSLPCWPVELRGQNGFAPALDLTARQPRTVNGLRVVDFSALWAGPLCANLLGLAGAEVIKVESIRRPDAARDGNPPFYRVLHGGHRSVTFDPDDVASCAAIDELTSTADIVIEASRPRALRRLGIDAELHVARGVTWLSVTAAGRSSARVGFGDDVAASAGLIAHDFTGAACFVGDAIADPLTGLFAAALATTRRCDGLGELWDVSMSDVVKLTLQGHGDTTPAVALGARPPTLRPAHESAPAPTLGADNVALLGLRHATEEAPDRRAS